MKQRSEKQLQFGKVGGWGGKRSGAGRHNISGQVNHMKRPEVSLKLPMHITLRLKEKLPSIRNKNLFKEFQKSVVAARKLGLYVIHYSIQSNHIHLFCESISNNALALGMRALAGRFAKIVRSYCSARGFIKKGSVFKGRYHLHVLRTPHETKNALEYVLLNLSKHQKFIEYIDRFSSGGSFRDWRKLLGRRFSSLIKADADFFDERARRKQGEQDSPQMVELCEILSLPQSWLARSGWQRA